MKYIFVILIILNLTQIGWADPTQTIIVPHAVYSCSSSGQVCSPSSSGSISLNQSAEVSAFFSTSARHCSDIKVNLSGSFAGSTDFLSAGEASPNLFTKSLSAGIYPYSVKATGRAGGCNYGWLASWSGYVTFSVKYNSLMQEDNFGPPDENCI